MFNIIILGAPGSGKGTQAKLIAEKYNLNHISTGELIREEIENKTDFGIKIERQIAKGEFASDEEAIDLVLNRIKNYNTKDGFIFDGFPRTLNQAEIFYKLLTQNDVSIDCVLNLVVSEDLIFDRISNRAKQENRPEDSSKDVIQTRIDIYNDRTKPVEDFYKKLGNFKEVNGNLEVNNVFEEITNAVDFYFEYN